MRPTASHNIKLTENVPISATEKGTWTKIMIRAANLKLKMTKKIKKSKLKPRFADDGANFSINSDDPMVTGTWTQQVISKIKIKYRLLKMKIKLKNKNYYKNTGVMYFRNISWWTPGA